MGEKGVGKLSRETPPPREGEPMGARSQHSGLFLLTFCNSTLAFYHCFHSHQQILYSHVLDMVFCSVWLKKKTKSSTSTVKRKLQTLLSYVYTNKFEKFASAIMIIDSNKKLCVNDV